MPQLISILILPRIQTFEDRADYEAKTGKPCPPWNPQNLPKSWLDPKAANSVEDMVIYKAFTGFKSGKATWKSLFLTPQEALTVNIAPTGEGSTNVPGADRPARPVPMRDLAPGEEVRPSPGPMGEAGPVVWTGEEIAAANANLVVGFTVSDRAALQENNAILKRLDTKS